MRKGAEIGPCEAATRCDIGVKAKVGNFVEIKKALVKAPRPTI